MLSSLLLLGLSLLTAPDETTYIGDTFGLAVELPDGWTVDEKLATESSLQVVFSPPGTPTVQLTIFVRPGAPHDAEAMRELSLAAVGADGAYTNPRKTVRSVAGREVPGLAIDADYQGQALLLRQAYIVENGFPFVIQDFAPLDEAAALAETHDAIWNGLRFTELSPASSKRRALVELAQRCGSEVHWASDWDAAVVRSRAERKPILVAARMYAGFSISDGRMTGSFMDQDTIDLLNERYVPLDVGKQDVAGLPFAAHERYGMGPRTFGEATLVVTPDGDVLDEANPLTDAFLRRAATLDPDLPGPQLQRPDDRLQLARLHYRRGELDQVFAVLAEPQTAGEYLLLHEVHRRLRQGEAADDALTGARQAPGHEQLSFDIALETATLRVLQGQTATAVETLDQALADAPDHERVPELLLTRAVLAFRQQDKPAAEVWLRRLLDEHPGSRWAWKAAGYLTSTGWDVDSPPPRLAWPDEVLIAALEQPIYEPLSNDLALRASRDALQYLLDQQQPDGSWITLGEDSTTVRHAPHHFDLAAASICSQALLTHSDRPDVSAALTRSLAWLLTAYERARVLGEPAYYMDYTCWSRAYMLAFLAAAADAGLMPRGRLAGPVASMLDELAERQKPGGGWSYYVAGDLDNADSPTLFAMSFTTAAVVLALIDAREAGFEVPDSLIDGGLDTVERARLEDVYTYMVYPTGSPQQPLIRGGSAGRGPVCALALHRGGRAELDEVRSALAVFDELRPGLASELGKNLMHTGPQGQGSHYLLFDYRNAAAAAAALPAADRAPYRSGILEELLRARTTQGGFVDNPLNGQALGAGMALAAFHDLSVGG